MWYRYDEALSEYMAAMYIILIVNDSEGFE